jgi:predicted transcriptional regulator
MKIRIGVGDEDPLAKGFVEAWKRTERGEKSESEHRLHFENLETLLKTLTSARWALLKTLRAKGPMSIRALARELGRGYKNVHTDVQRLKEIGLIERGEDDNTWRCLGIPLKRGFNWPLEGGQEEPCRAQQKKSLVVVRQPGFVANGRERCPHHHDLG